MGRYHGSPWPVLISDWIFQLYRLYMSTAFYGYSPVALVRVCRITDLGNGAYGLGVGLLGQKVGTPAGTAPPEPLPSQPHNSIYKEN